MHVSVSRLPFADARTDRLLIIIGLAAPPSATSYRLRRSWQSVRTGRARTIDWLSPPFLD
eukprot:3354991-Pleurochrysis_carterae.AAC.2